MRSTKTIAGLIVGSVAVATLAFSSTFAQGPARAKALNAITSAAPAKAPVVRVSGMDFSFDAPDVIPAGLTEFRFTNKGPSLHHMQILKLEGGKTVDDLRVALANPGPPPAWVKEVGGPNAPAPGLESNTTVMLEPGNYALICFVDIGGPPHFMKGMVRALRVVPSTDASAPTPNVDVTATLFDYGFKLSSPIQAGTRTIRVLNGGAQHHEIELVQLLPGGSAADFLKWMGKMEGPPPGKPLGGVAALDVGASQYFTADFAPGNYALICFLPDAKDGKPHFAHGMIQQITVN
ncbi:MAG TPA: hypothetical protein VK542_08155 [Gemmatimonadaceae bacterium]|nr:hypothetical protein [Gemmatimonadaceae bacterium]